MLARTQLTGTDTLNSLVKAAAERAHSVLPGALVLTACDGVTLDQSADDIGLALEAWVVRADESTATMTAFAVARSGSGQGRIAASGRFTFSLRSNERGSAA